VATDRGKCLLAGRSGVALLVVPLCSALATAQVIERVNVSSTGAEANHGASGPTISAEGRYVAFSSGSTNLTASDTNSATDIFTRDRATGQTTRVSVSTGADQGNDDSDHACISADGRFAAFESVATNLVAGDVEGYRDVFVRDQLLGQTERISVDTTGAGGGNDSERPCINSDGRFVAYVTSARKLAGSTEKGCGIIRRDRQSGSNCTVYWGDPGDSWTYMAAINADGRLVAYSYTVDPVGSGPWYWCTSWWDALTGSRGGDADCCAPAVSATGRYVAVNQIAEMEDFPMGVAVIDRQLARTTEIASGFSCWFSAPSISADGRFVTYASDKTMIVPDDTNDLWDVFVHDMQAGITRRVSLSMSGAEADDDSNAPVISSDGRYIAFTSYATNLVPNDTNGALDVFVARNPLVPWPPDLSWAGPPGYRRSGVRPASGLPGSTVFRFKVRVTDPDGDEPDFVRLILRRDGELWTTINMTPGSGEITSGRVYLASRRLPVGNYAYRFRARDGDGEATGAPTEVRNGPLMDSPPYLHWATLPGYGPNDGVRPNSGKPNNTRFRFKVMYRDNEGDMARYVRLTLWRNGALYRTVPMRTGESTPDPATSILYKVAQTLPWGTYRYQFKAADDDGKAAGPASVRLSGLQVGSTSSSLALTGLTAVPTAAGAQITFSLSRRASVGARVLNIAGRPVRALCTAQECNAGTNTLLWDSRTNQGLALPNGTYLVEVSAEDDDGQRSRGLTYVYVSR
jgi:hypothetical protein